MGMDFKTVVKKIELTFITININRTNFEEDILYDFLKPENDYYGGDTLHKLEVKPI